MNVEDFRTYCLSKRGVIEDLPFDDVTLTFKVMGKIFAITGLDREEFTVNLKCDPERAIALREDYEGEIIPGFHMNKKHWNTVSFDGDLKTSMLLELVDHSYDLVVGSLKKSLRAELEAME